MPDDQRPVAVEKLTERGDFTDPLEGACLDDRQRFVEPDRLALAQGFGLDVRRARQTHLATGGEHVDRLVIVHAQQHAVATRWLPEAIDLFTKRDELLTRFLERVHQLRVANRQRVDPRFQFTRAIR